MMSKYKELGQYMKAIRIKNKVKTKDMSKICDCTTNNIYEFERGNTRSISLILKYIKTFKDIDINEVIKYGEKD